MKRIAMALIRFYRKYLSGLKPAPTCLGDPISLDGSGDVTNG